MPLKAWGFLLEGKEMANRKVLLLNKSETILDVITWQTAVCLLVKGNARVPFGYEEYYKIPVSLQSAQRMQEEKQFDVSIEEKDGKMVGYFLLPQALVLVEYVHIPYKRVSVNRKNVLKRDGYKCGYCETELTDSTGTIDHIVPQSRWKEFKAKKQVRGNHPNSWKNVVACCQKCNCKKDNKTPKEAGMKLKVQPFVPSKDYLIFHTIDMETCQRWTRWLCFDQLK